MKIKNSTVESTPFVDVEITETVKGPCIAWFRLYWTVNAGMYGHQVCFQGSSDVTKGEYFTGKTNGCGYSKECQGLEDCISTILKPTKHFSCGRDARSLLGKHHTGGNSYKLSLSQLRKAIKR